VAHHRIGRWLGLGLLVAVSALARTRELGVGLWLDEGLSIGIADRPIADIPGVLRQDGSPPLYYLLLHGWMAMAGRSEAATHALSLLFALVAVPVAFCAARALLGGRAGWIAALLTALNPFLSEYAQETRMYSLLVVLAFVSVGCWVRALAIDAPTRSDTERRSSAAIHRAPTLGFSLSFAAMLYTHNWALFFGAAAAVAWLILLATAPARERDRLVRTGVIGYGVALALYLPWVPSLLYQTAHTGAPWATAPALEALLDAPARLLGDVTWLALLLTCGVSVAVALRRGGSVTLTGRRRAAVAIGTIAALTVALPWLTSQISPTWATRYLTAALAPSLLLCAAATASAGRLGLAAVAITAIAWAGTSIPTQKSNVRAVATAIGPDLRPGDLVVSTRPGEIPVLHHYLPEGLRYATLTGPVRDVGVTDWRDLVTRLRETSAARDLEPLLDTLPVGHRVALVEPIIYDPSRWNAPSTALVRQRTRQWHHYLAGDPSLAEIDAAPESLLPRPPNPVRATVYLKISPSPAPARRP
jgi:mannosyltransferase